MIFYWTEFSHAWSKNGVKYTQSQIALHLKHVIRAEKFKAIPARPPVPIPQRKLLQKLGELTVDVKNSDAHDLSKETVLMIKLFLKKGHEKNLELEINILRYKLIQCQKWTKVSLVTGLMFSANSLWTRWY